MPLVLVLAAAAALAVPQAKAPGPPALEPFRLDLACFGTAEGTILAGGVPRFSDEDPGDQADLVTPRQVFSDGTLRISIVGLGGVIRVPDQMRPPLRGARNADGGFELTDVDVGDRSIAGQVRFNALSRSRFTIDRTTGVIEMSGLDTGFSGRCARVSN